MSKKLIAIILTLLALVSVFAGCGTKTTCDWCGEEKSCKTKTVLGDEIHYCNDCMKELEELY